jgi:hypothetical protein
MVKKEQNMKLSNQAIGAVMMALQKSLMEQTDIVPVLRDFKLEVDDSNQIVIMNPPTVKVPTMKSPGSKISETTK